MCMESVLGLVCKLDILNHNAFTLIKCRNGIVVSALL